MDESNYSDDFQAIQSIIEGYDPGRGYISDVIYVKHFNKNNPKKSIIRLTFGVSEFVNLINFSESSGDVDFVNRIFGNSSYYYGSSLESMTWDTAYEEWEEGYVLGYFNNENNEILKDILMHSPTIIDPYDYKSITKFLDHSKFEREVGNIITEYQDFYNDCVFEQVKKQIKGELSNILLKFNIFEKYFLTEYYTTAGNLYRLYDKYKLQDENIEELIKRLLEGVSDNVGGYWDEFYSMGCGNFDRDEFNRSIKMYLEKILEKIEEGFYDEDFDREEYERTLKYIQKLKGVSHNGKMWYSIPTMKGYSFIINHINYKAGIEITVYKNDDELFEEKRLIKFKDFPSFIENYKLFESKRQKKFYLIK